MSILDGFYSKDFNAEQFSTELQNNAHALLSQIEGEPKKILAEMLDGASLSDIIGFGKEPKEALLQLGCQLMESNELEQAGNIFFTLAILDPLEERAYYGVGVVEQMRGNLQKAAQFYMQFLVLDATNPQGYLRLGECLVRANELGEARSAYLMAKQLAEAGHGSQADLTEASKQLNSLH